jgi:aryl sulfotransferase
VRYRTGLTDSARWDAVDLRPDDIVLSVPSKCGTTWLQMLCALLVFRTPGLPAPLTELSPWVDMRLRPIDELVAQLDAQRHRRFLKTHTPLDGLPRREGVRYVVMARDPRDVAVSMAHHRANLNAEVIEGARRTMAGWPSFADRVAGWIADDRPVAENLSSLKGTLHHLAEAWVVRADPAVVLLHYADVLEDLEGSMRRLAEALSIEVPDAVVPSLVEAARFDRMREVAPLTAPHEGIGLLADDRAFFRTGGSGTWRTELPADAVAAYGRRLHELAVPADLAAWLHR